MNYLTIYKARSYICVCLSGLEVDTTFRASAMFYFSLGLDTSQVYSRAAVSRLKYGFLAMRFLEMLLKSDAPSRRCSLMVMQVLGDAGSGVTADGRVSS